MRRSANIHFEILTRVAKTFVQIKNSVDDFGCPPENTIPPRSIAERWPGGPFLVGRSRLNPC